MVINDQKKSNQKLDLILDEIKSIKKFYGVVDQEFLNVNIFVYFFLICNVFIHIVYFFRV